MVEGQWHQGYIIILHIKVRIKAVKALYLKVMIDFFINNII
jgi:hypothetical protein